MTIVKDNLLYIPVTNFSEEEAMVYADEVVAKVESIVAHCSVSSVQGKDDRKGEESENIEYTGRLPDHLEQMIDKVSPKTSTDTKEKLRTVIHEYQDVFQEPGGPSGRFTEAKHAINVEGHAPIKLPPRRYPIAQREVVEKEVKKMLDADIIEPSTSPWSANIVLVKKKDGSVRFCVDYRRLNSVTKKDAYPLPNISDSLDALSGSRLFSVVDLVSGFHQCELEESDREKTAFNTHQGLYQFKVLPFGISNSTGTFQRMMELVLSGLLYERCLVYIDDVVIIGKTEEEALGNLKSVFGKFRQANLKLKPSKCLLFQDEVNFLGHTVNSDGTTCEKSKVEAVQNWPEPKKVSRCAVIWEIVVIIENTFPLFLILPVPL